MWFKKKSVLQGEGHYDSNTAYDGTDWRTSNNIKNWSVSWILPSAADAGKYFYLPALGYYHSNQLDYVGGYGHYWSSSAIPWYSYMAYGLVFSGGDVSVKSYGRWDGNRVDGGFE